MEQAWVAVVSIAFLALVAVFIYVLLELRRSAKAFNEFLKTTEDSLKPTLEELQNTLRSIRKVSDDVNTVTNDMRLLSGSVRDIGDGFKKVSELINEINSEALIKVSSMRVGIKTALEVLLKNLLTKGGSQ